MPEILELSEVHSRLVRWSVEQYERMAEEGKVPRRAELLRGLIIKKPPKAPLHRALAAWLYDWLHRHVSEGLVVFHGTPLRLADSEPEPDFSVVCGRMEDFNHRHPVTAALVVEVTVGSAALDRANAPLYAEAGVEEYWIVLGNETSVEVYSQVENGTYRSRQTFRAGETVSCGALPGVALAVGELFTLAE